MKLTTTMTMMLALGLTGAHAQTPVAMTFSGDGSASVMDLKQPNATTSEQTVAGFGTSGPFTFRLVRASTNDPQPSTTCAGPTKVYFESVAGAGLFRFFDGSLMTVNVTGGGDCIDFNAPVALCALTLQVTGGTGRFQGATGVLNLTEGSTIVLSDAAGNPIYFAEKGELTGTITRGPDSKP